MRNLIPYYGALLFICTGACTITTTSDTSDGGTGSNSTTSSSSSGGAGSTTTSSPTSTSSSTGGAGGATGGSGGAGGSGGSVDVDGGGGAGGSSSMDGGVVNGDPCNDGGTETTPNEDRDHATAYTLGSQYQACLQSDNDVDFYQFTIPTTPAQGGYVKVSVTDVGTDGDISVHAFAAHDNGEFDSDKNSTGGGSVFLWFGGKAGATFRVEVTKYLGVSKPTPYKLLMQYFGINDVNEPNDDNAHATPIMVGKAVTGYFFAGLEDSTDPAPAAWEDRFKVTLPAGDVTVALTNIATDMTGQVKLYNPLGSEIGVASDSTGGSSVVLKHTVAAGDAGDCIVLVNPYLTRTTRGQGSTVPVFYTQPYTLTVTTP
jgi:hypothetical protein